MTLKSNISTKHLAISKANAQIVAVVATASFITVFCLVAAKAVWSQNQYQTRVTKAENAAHVQLQHNIAAFGDLVDSYQAFASQPTNVIGGSSTGTGNNSGNNANIVLDALPSSYDFPALTSSLEKILTQNNLSISSITGTDDELAQQSNTSSPNPQPVSMPFSFSIANASYASVQQLMTILQESIRPIQVDSITLSGGTNDMQLTVNAHTYYQPVKSLGITTEVVQ